MALSDLNISYKNVIYLVYFLHLCRGIFLMVKQ